MKKYSLIVSTIFLIVLFLNLFSNYTERFDAVEDNYQSKPKSAINLEKGISYEELSDVLYNHNYITNKAEADFVSKFITQKLEDGRTLSTLYDLNKRIWQIPVSLIDSIGTNGYKERATISKESIGIDKDFLEKDISSLQCSDTLYPNQYGVINVTVTEKIENSGPFFNETKYCANVVVRLSKQYVDSLDNNKSKRQTIAYLKTNEQGKVSFCGLDPNLSYSVLPIKEGFEYGTSKGTIGGNLSKYDNATLESSFTQQEHKIRIFDAQTLKQIKEDKALTIRSPKEFKNILVKYVVLFFIAWWGLWFISRVYKKPIDNTMLSILMTLTGLCLLTMFSLNDPLTDKLLGVDMAQGIIVGVILIAILMNVNIKKFYQNQSSIDFDIPLKCIKWIFKPFKFKVTYLTRILSNNSCNVLLKSLALLGILICLPLIILDLVKITSLYNAINKSFDRLPKGFGYLLMALMLTALLFTPLGVAVGGMTVNLNIGFTFQPSEIAKYLIIFFMAAYFSVNANKIVQFSEVGNTKLFGAKLKMLTSIFLGLGILMGLYLVLGDMGPALVLAFTFIILYSIIKSKVDLEGITIDNQLKRIFTCDIAMLVYGILSFIVFLYVGYSLDNMGIFCLAWFVLWIIFGVAKQKIYETPILFNFIIAVFIFGGTVLKDIPGLDSIADRLDSRTEMCTNTWGTLPLDGDKADAGENTQVAEGLWGLASGGFWGQGLGNGSPHFIPAFHTDMILESIGEQMGFVGVFIIILLLAVLLRRTIVVGYKTSHPFTFYLCMGVAIVTAVQFVIISLGSTGIIPLTGVTVPFLSCGMVSMILNLTAFGIVLSIASHSATETVPSTETTANLTKQNIAKYNYSVSLLSWMYCAVAVFICGVFLYYQLLDRNDTLIRPVYVNNSSGIPIVEYNPRIEQLTQKMHSGDIYDRNGVLLATSDRAKLRDFKNIYSKLKLECDTIKRLQRYYPFGEHLFFMLGDFNSKLYFSADAESRFPKGYMAESKHISDLRGYDNKKRDRSGKPIKLDLCSNEFAPDKYHSNKYCISYIDYQIRDYSALIPYLKEGLHSNKVKRLNERESGDIEPKDIQLTIDAELQTELQNEIDKYVKKNHSHLNKLRVSVVILDGKNGDLLTSALYPLPNYNTLKNNADTYNDINRDKTWRSYTDMDLGLIFPSDPGSTAKVVTGLAGYKKEGNKIENAKYYIYPQEMIFSGEPVGQVVDMNLAFKKSSNCYFVNLLNDRDLFEELATTYATLGISINGNKSYGLNYHEPTIEWLSLVTSAKSESLMRYESYKKSGKWDKMSVNKPRAWGWSWGQYGITATPIAMARAMSVVVNNGVMPITRYTLHDEVKKIELLSSTARLNKHLKDTRASHEKSRSFSKLEYVGGKTGTPERTSTTKRIRTKKGEYITVEKDSQNDGWYICFIENANITSKVREQDPRKQEEISETLTQAPLAIAVRMERLGKGEMSGKATQLMDEVIIKSLKNHGYIK